MLGEQAFCQGEGDNVKSLGSGKWGVRTGTDQEDNDSQGKGGVFHNLRLTAPAPRALVAVTEPLPGAKPVPRG